MRTCMIFAAGLGTRMRPLTDHTPKPLIKVAGRVLLDHALDLTCQAGITTTIVNAHYLADQIVTHLAGRDVQVSVEPTLLDTGGGLKAAAAQIDAPFVTTLNSDAIWRGPNPITQLWAQHRGHMGALLLLAPVHRLHGRDGGGDFGMGADGRLTRGGDLLYLGAQIIAMEQVTKRPEDVFSLNLCWDDLAQVGGLYGCIYDGDWCDVGRPENIAMAEALLDV